MAKKKFEVRGVRTPYSSLVTRKTYDQQPTEDFVNIECDWPDPKALAILCLNFAECATLPQCMRGFKSLVEFPNVGRHAFIHWKLTPVKMFQFERDNEEWLLANPDIAERIREEEAKNGTQGDQAGL